MNAICRYSAVWSYISNAGQDALSIAGLLLSNWEDGGITGVLVRKNTTSLFIQAMDLGLIVPACILSGILLLRRHAWGYLLASVELVIFPGMALAGVVMTVVLLKHVKE